MTDKSGAEGFAPADYSDGRDRYDWRTRYPDEAKNKIRREAIYLTALLILAPFAMLLVLNGPFSEQLTIAPTGLTSFPVLLISWLGGVLGGTIYTIKWLYHVVGKGWWHEDRSLWRFLTPHVSGAVSFSFISLVSSELLPILSLNGTNSILTVIGLSFLLGYFSDTAVAKLSEIASVLFGTVKDHEPSEPSDVGDNE